MKTKKTNKASKDVEYFFQTVLTENHNSTLSDMTKVIGISVEGLPNKKNGDKIFTKSDPRKSDDKDITRYWSRMKFTITDSKYVKVPAIYNIPSFTEMVNISIKKNSLGVNFITVNVNNSEGKDGWLKIVKVPLYKVPAGSYKEKGTGNEIFKFESRTPIGWGEEQRWKLANYEELASQYLAPIHSKTLDIVKKSIGELAISEGICDEDTVWNPVYKSAEDFNKAKSSKVIKAGPAKVTKSANSVGTTKRAKSTGKSKDMPV